MLRHRGPDQMGIWHSENVALGHTRLNLVDAERGAQPMSNGNGSLWTTFNGELFNHEALREELVQGGHVFRTQCDTEVLLHLYEDLKENCVDKLNGQWAFAIWDVIQRRLFLSRDRLGICPLYYTIGESGFAFASEQKALLANPVVSRELDPDGLDQVFSYWSTVPPRTVFKEVRELPPGHSAELCERQLRVHRYWTPVFGGTQDQRSPVGTEEKALECLSLLEEAVRLRITPAAKIGVYLSGGLDSSIVAALAAREGDVTAFSLRFEDPGLDEGRFQAAVTDHLAIQSRVVDCKAGDILHAFPETVWHSETPLLRTAPVPMYLLSQLAHRSGFKHVLTGEGADELFAGYDIFKEAKIRDFCAKQPSSHLRPMLWRRVYPYLPRLQEQKTDFLKMFFDADITSDLFASHRPRWNLNKTIRLFYSAEIVSSLKAPQRDVDLQDLIPENFGKWDALTRAQYLETVLLLPGYILSSQADRANMANAIEGRYPFLDLRVVNFALGLSGAQKMPVLREKHLLKLCAATLLPKGVLARGKQPYRAPDAQLFFQGSAEYVEQMLSPAEISRLRIFKPDAVDGLVRKFRNANAIGARDSMLLTGILSTQLLCQKFCCGAAI